MAGIRTALGRPSTRPIAPSRFSGAVLEKHVQEAVVAFLEIDGWRPIRTDPVSDRSRGKGFGEIGMPDYLFVRYHAYVAGPVSLGPAHTEDLRLELGDCSAEVLWLEFKRPGKKATVAQRQWHAIEAAGGALVKVVDDFDAFREWYLTSGLNRRIKA